MGVCAVHAISELNGSILVDTEKCIGCGSCKTACVAFGYKALQNKSPQFFMKHAA
jgi:Fe-S-cluster-containing hydrogenase component 2